MILQTVIILLLHISLNSCSILAQHPDGEQLRFGGHDEVNDAEHIKQHLQDKIDVDQAEMDEEQRRFHYFFMHDLNKDNMIDGNEIIKAMVHEHFTEGSGEAKPLPTPNIEESAIEKMVDSILREMDANNDGFLDYAEYTRNQMSTS